jgi:hypothetical protein
MNTSPGKGASATNVPQRPSEQALPFAPCSARNGGLTNPDNGSQPRGESLRGPVASPTGLAGCGTLAPPQRHSAFRGEERCRVGRLAPPNFPISGVELAFRPRGCTSHLPAEGSPFSSKPAGVWPTGVIPLP